MSNVRPLSSDDIRGLREELAAGGRPTVWFTSSAVGVDEGRSGKVTSLDEPAEGDFIQVRPANSKDVLSFSAGEVTVVKPARTRKEPASAKAPQGSATASASGTSAAKSATGGGSARKPAASASAAGSNSARAEPARAEPAQSAPAPKAKPKHPAGASVTLTAGQEGQWHVEVNNGRKRVVKPTPVSASAVASAAKELHDEVAQAVEPLLEAAREHQRTRVEQLQKELSDAQRMLDDLTG